ncbi:GspH/FimT family pseudopilin [Solilutibacter silvestris]|uniref:GspH/FimT family pseudopilin n=1 Tax=Solilutibacter silvestris TaxID=1645665 RepID=UPI003D34A2B4
MSRAQQGFTLIEIMLVMALVAIASALVASTISRNSGGQRLRDAAQQIAMGLRQARTEAMRSQVPQRFVLEPGQHRWLVAGRPAHPIDPDLEVTMTSARELSSNTQEGTIVFFPDGASTGGRVTLSRNGQRWRSDVNWITGEVVLQRDATP